MNNTAIRDLPAILADLDNPPSPYGTGDEFYRELEIAVRAQLATDPARMAPPRPDVSRNAGYTIRAVLPGHPAGHGLLESWWVAAEDAGSSQWVTWEAYRLGGSQAGQLAYNAGHYFPGPYQADNRRGALADLAVRAGLMPPVGLRLADEIAGWAYAGREDRRMVSRLRRYLAGR